ncbi:MAG: hypothetical protein ABI589_11805 [Burkholderiales bacterium]
MATTARPDGPNPTPGASSGTSHGGAGSASSGLDDAARAVKERAGAMYEDAKDTAKSRLNEQKDVAAGGIDDMAGALHDAAKRRDQSEGHDMFADLTDSAASGLDRLSGALRNKDVGSMLRDMESFARNQPVAFFGLALAAGFLAVRFLKASDDNSQAAYDDDRYSGGSVRGMSANRLGGNTFEEDSWKTR